MRDNISESVLLEVRVPSTIFSKLIEVSNKNDISVNSAIMHFVSVGLVTLDYFK